jgi:hypothetical protein
MAITFSEEQVRYARGMVHRFSLDWHSEVPVKIHQSAFVFDEGGGPAFSNDFISYMDDALRSKRREERPRGPHDIANPRRRVSQAFRTLRNRAPREWDAMRCLVVIDQVGRQTMPRDVDALDAQFEASLRATAARFNERAERMGKPERYTPDDILLLVVSAVDKLAKWAS